eukprot:PLAT3894.1.p1 GENE.PLAT3894.1~~PLAT3894.1.p1  ORF type:complete len:298 (+),score=110.84 PLAT3894.1:28-921(+)
MASGSGYLAALLLVYALPTTILLVFLACASKRSQSVPLIQPALLAIGSGTVATLLPRALLLWGAVQHPAKDALLGWPPAFLGVRVEEALAALLTSALAVSLYAVIDELVLSRRRWLSGEATDSIDLCITMGKEYATSLLLCLPMAVISLFLQRALGYDPLTGGEALGATARLPTAAVALLLSQLAPALAASRTASDLINSRAMTLTAVVVGALGVTFQCALCLPRGYRVIHRDALLGVSLIGAPVEEILHCLLSYWPAMLFAVLRGGAEAEAASSPRHVADLLVSSSSSSSGRLKWN